MTRRSSTIAAAAILTAVEQLKDADYKVLERVLISVLKEFDFDSLQELLDVCDHLKRLVDDDKDSQDRLAPEIARDESCPTTEAGRDDDSCTAMHYCY